MDPPNFWWKDNGFETTKQFGAIAILNVTVRVNLFPNG